MPIPVVLLVSMSAHSPLQYFVFIAAPGSLIDRLADFAPSFPAVFIGSAGYLLGNGFPVLLSTLAYYHLTISDGREIAEFAKRRDTLIFHPTAKHLVFFVGP